MLYITYFRKKELVDGNSTDIKHIYRVKKEEKCVIKQHVIYNKLLNKNYWIKITEKI